MTNARGLATMYAHWPTEARLDSTRLLPADHTAGLGLMRSALPIDRTMLVAMRPAR